MKKQKNHQAINLLLSTFLVFSIFLTNIGPIVVYAQETLLSTQDDEEMSEVTDGNEKISPFKIDTLDIEEEQDIQHTFDKIYEELNSFLDDAQENLLEIILGDDELSSLLQEAIIFHETNAFEEANALYEEILSHLNKISDKEQTEVMVSEKMIKLIEEFKALAEEEKSLFEYKKVEDEDSSSDENEKLIEEEVEKSPSNDIAVEQEMESTDQTEDSINQSGIKSPKKEKASDPILSEKSIQYEGKLLRAYDGINTKPYGVEGYKTIRLVKDWVGKRVLVTKEAVTPRATWSYVHVSGTNVSGWVDKKGLAIDTITSQKEVLYDAKLLRASDGINTKPFGTEGYETIRLVDDLVGQQVRVTKEAKTLRATWAYIEVLGTDIAGWIDIKGIKLAETILSEKTIQYEGKLTRANDGINTKPYGVEGYKTTRLVKDWVGKRVLVTKEAVTPRATWSYVHVSGTNVSGWVDKKGLAIDTINSQKEVLYDAKLLRISDGINTKPFGTEGYETIRLVDDLVGQQVRVIKEAKTPRATWAYIEVPGTDIAGWIDIKGIKLVETILSEKSVQYEGKLTRANDGINTKPYGVEGYKTTRLVKDWVGKRVLVTKEAVTPRATWLYIHVSGTNVSGWIDKAGVQAEKILSEKNVNYNAYLTRPSDGINSQPYGIEGYKTIRLVDDLVGNEVRVTKEAVTSRGTWVHIHVINTNISGWIDKAGTSLGAVAIRMTYYDISFKSVLDIQMNKGTPKTDAYSGGKRWDNAKKEDVAYYLNPENFLSVKNGSATKYIDKIQISTTALNVRTTFPNGTVIGTASKNEIYDVLAESNGWYRINFKGKEGWVSGSYVSPISKIHYQNEIDDPRMLQFLSLSRPSGISVRDLNKELEGKGILEGKGQTFIEASQKYNINEIYLVSHALLETGNGTSKLATGVKINGVIVYNMFGIGAYDDMAVEAGSQRAYNEGWDTPEKAIIGGAQFIANSYINSSTYKQDTLYKMRWNPANPTVHQYATDIGWAVKQTRSLDKIIELSDKYNLVLNFDIPVYK